MEPDETVTLWRYMDLAKFISMLHTSTLYFARADKMEDTFEAALPKKFLDSLRARRMKSNPTGDITKDKLFQLFEKKHKEFYLNCWYMNEHESAAMWKLYCGQGEGIAICTSLKRLKRALKKAPHEIHAGIVNYIDYDNDHFKSEGGYSNTLSTIVHKRKSFEHEREMRLVIWGITEFEREFKDDITKQNELGLLVQHDEDVPTAFIVPVDVKLMIQRVMVSPTAPDWFMEVVGASLKKFGFPKVELKQSALYSKPLY